LLDIIEVAHLQTDLDQILSALEDRVKIIGFELAKPVKIDDSLVVRKLSEITMLTHKFMQFMPRIALSRNEFVKNNGPMTPEQSRAWSHLTTGLYRYSTWITNWPRVEKLVRLQVPAKRHKLYRRPIHTEAATVSQLLISDQIFENLHDILSQHSQDDSAAEHGCFADIALPQSVFIEHIHAAHRVLLAKRLKHPSRFLDVGCGGGLKVLSAACFFGSADGLEYDAGYVATARHLFEKSRSGGCHVIHADGLTYENYDDYDVIYFYRPMRQEDLLRQLEEQIVQTARPGTLIIAPYKMFDFRYKELGCARISGRLYMTQTRQSDADALRKNAEMTGVSVIRQVQSAASIWDPILKASMAKGFAFESDTEGFSASN
jgi:SAM-dependent methyltransferase